MTEPLLGSTPFSIENGNRNRPLESDGVSKDSVAGVSLSRREAREAGAERLQTWADWRHVAAWGLRLDRLHCIPAGLAGVRTSERLGCIARVNSPGGSLDRG